MMIIIACLAVPSLLLVMCVMCLVMYCHKKSHVSKSTSQEQPLANSGSLKVLAGRQADRQASRKTGKQAGRNSDWKPGRRTG